MSVQSMDSSASYTCSALDTEDTIDTQTTPGVYVLVLELNNLANDDILIVRLKTKLRTGGTSRLAYQSTYANVQTELNKYSIPIPVDTEIIFTAEQTNGTLRAFGWNMLMMG